LPSTLTTSPKRNLGLAGGAGGGGADGGGEGDGAGGGGEGVGGGTALVANVAVTLRAELMVTTHGPVPEQPLPDQPAKCEPTEAVAAKATTVPSSKSAVHVEPQSIPTAETEPEPAPSLATLSVWTAVNVAVTDRAELVVTTQLPAPEQPPPDQPLK